MSSSRSLPLLRVFGIRIGANLSWFIVLFVVIFVLWDSLRATLDASDTTVYVVAVISALAFFASILLHELGHALVAQRSGIEITGIDLWFFGGLASMSRDTNSPGEEFRVSAAWPRAEGKPCCSPAKVFTSWSSGKLSWITASAVIGRASL